MIFKKLHILGLILQTQKYGNCRQQGCRKGHDHHFVLHVSIIVQKVGHVHEIHLKPKKWIRYTVSSFSQIPNKEFLGNEKTFIPYYGKM